MCVCVCVCARMQDITDTALCILSEVYKDKSTMARSLIKIFIKLGSVSCGWRRRGEETRRGGGRELIGVMCID